MIQNSVDEIIEQFSVVSAIRIEVFYKLKNLMFVNAAACYFVQTILILSISAHA